ncbi:MAG: helix-turn-helix domain-containing protein [Chromatiaceae bacterium]|nr:helix-turn-helix domain-containing protein [Chromatiaceae bacterium]MCF8004046.1 helix-turn-helix domain-containing protein [Chromatiaceae bacterium]
MSKQWFLNMVALEERVDIAAGGLAAMPSTAAETAHERLSDDTRLAFGTLVHLMRRRRALSAEKLADDAQVDLSEIVNIERDFHYRPEPRTVYQLAEVFSLPVNPLMQLSGNTRSKDTKLRQEAVRFAARSDSLERLSPDEQAVLEEFVSYLSRG